MNELIKLVEDTNKDMILSEAYQLFESQMVDLAERYKNGEITQEEYQKELIEMFGWLGKILKPKPTDPEVKPRTPEEQRNREKLARELLRSQGRERVIHKAADTSRQVPLGKGYIK